MLGSASIVSPKTDTAYHLVASMVPKEAAGHAGARGMGDLHLQTRVKLDDKFDWMTVGILILVTQKKLVEAMKSETVLELYWTHG